MVVRVVRVVRLLVKPLTIRCCACGEVVASGRGFKSRPVRDVCLYFKTLPLIGRVVSDMSLLHLASMTAAIPGQGSRGHGQGRGNEIETGL